MSVQSIRLGELRALLQGSAFPARWTEWSRAAGVLAEARVRPTRSSSRRRAVAGARERLGGAALEAQARDDRDVQ